MPQVYYPAREEFNAEKIPNWNGAATTTYDERTAATHRRSSSGPQTNSAETGTQHWFAPTI
jgi:hypothetical protein